eukprot:Lithocolla_globosa_v1_NODE_47_length_7891_cov_8.351582.p4 type:complete len:141 gc:universal NODE_47_length_7891_cov_8.351582:5780-6202(+)
MERRIIVSILMLVFIGIAMKMLTVQMLLVDPTRPMVVIANACLVMTMSEVANPAIVLMYLLVYIMNVTCLRIALRGLVQQTALPEELVHVSPVTLVVRNRVYVFHVNLGYLEVVNPKFVLNVPLAQVQKRPVLTNLTALQ